MRFGMREGPDRFGLVIAYETQEGKIAWGPETMTMTLATLAQLTNGLSFLLSVLALATVLWALIKTPLTDIREQRQKPTSQLETPISEASNESSQPTDSYAQLEPKKSSNTGKT